MVRGVTLPRGALRTRDPIGEKERMISPNLIRKWRSALPGVRDWIDDVLEKYKAQANPVMRLAFPRIRQVFPADLLERAKVVVLTGSVPFPPLSRMGLPEFVDMENMPMAGITYRDTFFISRSDETESLHFHELVHVVQWERLGVDDFLLAYGVGIIQSGYRNSPLEEMAYSLEEDFDRGRLPADLIQRIHQGTDAIRAAISLPDVKA
jgi:hypothetical protein